MILFKCLFYIINFELFGFGLDDPCECDLMISRDNRQFGNNDMELIIYLIVLY